jgi:hypothetical protein
MSKLANAHAWCSLRTGAHAQALKSAAPKISTQLPVAGAKAAAPAEAPSAAAAGGGANAAPSSAAPQGAPVQAADGTRLWKLGPSGGKHASVSEFKGTTSIGLREYYEKDGLRPTKKGINLSIAQFKTLAENVQVPARNCCTCSAFARGFVAPGMPLRAPNSL